MANIIDLGQSFAELSADTAAIQMGPMRKEERAFNPIALPTFVNCAKPPRLLLADTFLKDRPFLSNGNNSLVSISKSKGRIEGLNPLSFPSRP